MWILFVTEKYISFHIRNSSITQLRDILVREGGHNSKKFSANLAVRKEYDLEAC